MDRNYLLKIIERNFIVLNKDELSQKIENNTFFSKTLQRFVQKQSARLNDDEYRGMLHRELYDIMQNLLKRISENNIYDYELEK